MKTLFQLFKRRTRSGNYLPELDGLRFIAILLVVLFHSYVYFYPKPYPNNYTEVEGAQWISYFMAQGWFGVQVFFIISGFIITLPFAAHWIHGSRKPNIKNYLTRRFIRIEIPYFVALLLGFLILPHISSHSYQDLLPRLGASSLYAHSLIYSGELNPLLPPAWTLEIEIQFYLLAPLLALLFRISHPTLRRGTLLTLAVLSGFLPRLYTNTTMEWLDYTLAAHLPYFLLGMLMTELHLTMESPNKIGFDFIAIPLWLTLPLLLHTPSISFLVPTLLAVTMWMSMHGRALKHFLSRPWIAALGGMCYSIYLFHGAILELVKKHIVDQLIESKIEHSLHNLAPLILTAALVFLSAPLLYLCFEKPFMPKPRQK
ncbi:Peptidoglycan/LPS O-acetylase OafA/YrhL, contains acyltransferase and SGNH-hydrolase domains [Rubritalea squalenifaciens DSM 18772]|uniref:Peptidoglycan/LPS O-acetylase OafA/YrhL, contains acyltransferase and SGNH-hydrolase domains n=1 Tax=Rubritalea squalenifaciens DSM 18772 TaxID=1123071 RepID=A0A1M6LWK3_9BACT|nr:Peptidoglycan/LPS O-acetylase OafA/YrhL, contains acyltransferase and SGNH-hydrolase domains [Rubritalea squalenifaciens DSM 18772]